MPRTKFQTLTEQMFYILLCLKNECYGLDILDRVPAMTKGRVTVGSGTLYNLLEQFLAEDMIRETKVEGRRRSYILTQKGMDMLMEGRTVFVIAHRLSTVRNSDCIVVIEGGQIQEKGPHEQLLEEKGRYYMLYTGQHVLD